MYVCICNGITDRDIRAAVHAGARDLAQLSAATGCTTVCGSCAELTMEILHEVEREVLPLPMMAVA